MKKLLVLASALILSLGLSAQELGNFVGIRNAVSPEMKDGKLTLRLAAPYATRVQLSGGFLAGGPVEMARNDQGVWEYSLDMPAPELYTYNFIVDGVSVNDPANVLQQRDGTRYLSIVIVPGEFTENYFEANQRGNLEKVWYDSPTLGLNRRMYVYTPYGYDNPKNKKVKYPVLYLLHGAGGDEDAWSSMGRTCQIMDHLIANGEAEPMLVVMPNGNANQRAAQTLGLPQNQISREQAAQMSYTNSIVQDIVPYIEANYRVYKDKAHRAVAGLSMGGGHTATVSRDFPGTFDYVGVYSGAVGSIKDREGNLNQDMVNKLKAQQKAGYKLYWIACGNTDFLYQSNLEYMKGLDEIGFEYTWFESEGGHTWDNWRMYLDTFAPMLFK